ncbi:MAG: ATP-binding protein [bacterium]
MAIEFRIFHPGGKERWILGSGELIKDLSGRPERLVGTALDITDRKLPELQGKLIANILTTLNRPNDWPYLIRDILQQIKDFTGHTAVGIRLQKDGDYPYYEATGYPVKFIDSETSLCETDAQGHKVRNKEGRPQLACLCGQVIEGRTDPSQPFFTPNGSFWTNSLSAMISEDSTKSPVLLVRNHCLLAGFQSMALVPVKSGKQTVGLLQFRDTRPNRFTPETIRFLEELGETIGLAFQRITNETEIRHSEAKYRDIFTFAPVGIYQSTRDGKILSANPELANLLGYSTPEDILKLNMSKDLYWDTSVRDQLISLYEPDNSVRSVDLRWKRKDGTPAWVGLTAHAVKDSQGNTLYFEGFVSDATERKKADEIFGALNAAAMNIQRALTQDEIFAGISGEIRAMGGHCAIFQVDEEHHVIHTRYHSYDAVIVSAVEKILGKKSEEFPIPIHAVAEYRQVIEHRQSLLVIDPAFFLKQIFPEVTESMVIKFADLIKRTQVILAPIIENEKVIGILSVRSDRLSERDVPVITAFAHQIAGAWSRTGMFEKMNQEIQERQKIEAALVVAKDKAEESGRLKTSLLNNMSHEFRTPMNAILGFSSLIENDTVDPGFQDMAHRIHSAGSRLMKTLDDILEYSQLRFSALPEQIEPVDIYETLAGLIPKYRKEAGKKQVQVNYAPKSHPVVAIAQGHFVLLMDHLVENAIKFTKQGSISIRIRETGTGGKNWAEIAVSDTGIGIAKEHMRLIFEEFRQVSEGYGRAHEGSGLGLSIANRIVTMYGGLIKAESEPGKGSTFTVSLPLLAKEPVQEPKAQAPVKKRPLPEQSPGIPASFRKLNGETIQILVVEDNEDNVDVIKIHLNSKASLDVAFDGDMALKKIREKQFDVILMDIHLGSGKNGLDATRKIRKIPGYEFTPIIAVTGYTLTEDKDRIFSAGCTHYLGKPFTKTGLIHILQEAVSGLAGKTA